MTDTNNDSVEQLNEHTRSVYHQQHIRQGEDEVTRNRLMTITSEEFFQVEPDFFKGKKVLDAGCGSIARNAIAFYQMGSRDVTAMDLGEEWFSTAQKNMARYAVPIEDVILVNGNVSQLPFDSASFDFVCCDGVLPHLADDSQVEKTIKELGRVTKPGGYLFVSYLGGGGLIETKLHDGAREHYKENPAFAAFIDNIKPQMLHDIVDFAAHNYPADLFRGATSELNMDFIKSLLDEDLCIAIQNLLQAKRREHHSSEYVNRLLKDEGFAPPKLLKRFINRKNIRKFVTPFHFYSDHPFSKLLYGDGWVDCVTQKHG
jgi:ubiquinone/menaquinone biosynthesis C-methylase UbiE